jgi:sialidase-1
VFSNPAGIERENISIRISADGGQTWSEPRLVESGPGAYSDLVELPGRAVGVLFENGALWPYSRITFTRVEIEGNEPAGR